MRVFLVSLFLICGPAFAESPMTPTAFDAYVTGKTITYADQNGRYGAEQYLDGRRVKWAAENGDCMDGRWFASGDQICFEYEGIGAPQCWHFYRENHGLWARFAAPGSATVVFEREQTRNPLVCRGPDVGV